MVEKAMIGPKIERSCAGSRCSKPKMPVGTVVIRKKKTDSGVQKARYIKVRNDGLPQKRWMLYGTFLWEKVNGKIPKGYIVIHKDGDMLNDDMGNLIAGTSGMKLKLAHDNDPEWSQKQHARAASACGDRNRILGKIHRLRAYLPNYWYPVLPNENVILNVPFRRLKPMLAAFGVDVRGYPMNGACAAFLKKVESSTGMGAIRGRDISMSRDYTVVNPDLDIYSEQEREAMSERIGTLEKLPLWERAKQLSALDLRARN